MHTHEMPDTLMWIAIICLVILVAATGMYINRFFIHRAHRRALAELHRRASEPRHSHKPLPHAPRQ